MTPSWSFGPSMYHEPKPNPKRVRDQSLSKATNPSCQASSRVQSESVDFVCHIHTDATTPTTTKAQPAHVPRNLITSPAKKAATAKNEPDNQIIPATRPSIQTGKT